MGRYIELHFVSYVSIPYSLLITYSPSNIFIMSDYSDKLETAKGKTGLIRPIPLHLNLNIHFLTVIRNVGLSLLRRIVDVKLPLFNHFRFLNPLFFFISFPFLLLHHNGLGVLILRLTCWSQTRRDLWKEWWKMSPLPPSRIIHSRHLVGRNRIRRVPGVCWGLILPDFSIK